MKYVALSRKDGEAAGQYPIYCDFTYVPEQQFRARAVIADAVADEEEYQWRRESEGIELGNYIFVTKDGILTITAPGGPTPPPDNPPGNPGTPSTQYQHSNSDTFQR